MKLFDPLHAANLAGAFSAPFHTLTFTPELPTKLSRIIKLRDNGLVQFLSNDAGHARNFFG
jgi:hypothetical protein